MPKYKKISNEIKSRINSGLYKDTNNRIPDEISLCKEFNCSRMTIKKALDILVLEGLIYRKQGQGSFVMEDHAQSSKLNLLDKDLEGFTRSSNRTAKTKVIDFKLIFADVVMASKLNIQENSPVYEILRLRYINDNPYVLERTYMDPILIPGLTNEILNNSIYEYIEHTLNLKINSASKIIRAAKSNELDIKHLEVKSTDPILEVEQIAYLDNGKPFEYSFSRHRYDKFEFTSFSIRH